MDQGDVRVRVYACVRMTWSAVRVACKWRIGGVRRHRVGSRGGGVRVRVYACVRMTWSAVKVAYEWRIGGVMRHRVGSRGFEGTCSKGGRAREVGKRVSSELFVKCNWGIMRGTL